MTADILFFRHQCLFQGSGRFARTAMLTGSAPIRTSAANAWRFSILGVCARGTDGKEARDVGAESSAGKCRFCRYFSLRDIRASVSAGTTGAASASAHAFDGCAAPDCVVATRVRSAVCKSRDVNASGFFAPRASPTFALRLLIWRGDGRKCFRCICGSWKRVG